jgi:hypothetical protein
VQLTDSGGQGVSQSMLVTTLDPDGTNHFFNGAIIDGNPTIIPAATPVNLRFVFDGTTLFFFVNSSCLGGVPMASMDTTTGNPLIVALASSNLAAGYTISGIQFNGST